ncbi:729_t:CDS:2 [Paraglomus occultum]|uniref:729_t:CDS:1 n=1 Tax=Paraglomus occultum TaxID=144539 RepID=A0A9N9A3C7_9GLOM|nr:729_t:CDS:2 [Paraglomus occultum]
MPPERTLPSNRKMRERNSEHEDNNNDDEQDLSDTHEYGFPRTLLMSTDEIDSILEAGGSEEYEKMYKRMKLLIRIGQQEMANITKEIKKWRKFEIAILKERR